MPPWHRHRHREWHRRFRHSLRWRLVALFLLLALGTTLVFIGGTRQVIATGWRELVQPLFKDYVDRLAAEIGSPPDIVRAQALVQRLPIAVRIEGPTVNWASHVRVRSGYDPAVQTFLSRTTADGHVVRFGLGEWHTDDRRHVVVGVALTGLLLLLGLAFAYVRHLFRPLDDIRAGALRYGGGDFSQPIPLRRNDELGDLAAQVNGMASGLQQLLEGQRGLLLAISHELRSPLTRARLNAELVAEGEARDALLRDLALMRDMVSDLLESERLAGGHAALQREDSDLQALLREVVAQHFSGQAFALRLDPALPRLPLDRARMQMLLRNLLDNALRHSAGSTRPVQVLSSADAQALSLVVRDHGPGVADADLARLAQPFYRPDTARTRSSGGVGLGLYLCRLVAQSHGGELRFRNAQPGLEVTLRLPLPGAPAAAGV
ncbi:HAMP domain-containing sensor histidine kinase [Aquabacterium sp.]|uniref:HAMP domain-containing sensor histidine kinase n=1 Tax=Aquabacterium sp. TaxID=1872578 RepID=UPI002C852F16|nr:ATP-binding protein [Aquabacterium sp.]HSW08258.1 ATP-binding protein [Aquabacterium sp.]